VRQDIADDGIADTGTVRGAVAAVDFASGAGSRAVRTDSLIDITVLLALGAVAGSHDR
jgi:hypothetical protein